MGAGAAQLVAGGRSARLLAPAAAVVGLATELAVAGAVPGRLDALIPWAAAGVVLAAATLAVAETARLRKAALGVALGMLLIAPAVWSAQTVGHATSGTFPAGGPESAGLAAAPPGGAGGGLPGGPMFGGDATLTDALAYARSHGGGTIAVSSQSGAASAALSSGADVAALGGFSGRESEVTVEWLADRVASGRLRWVLTGGGSMGMDGRIGSGTVMAAAQDGCAAVTSIDGLYDCAGAGAALAGE